MTKTKTATELFNQHENLIYKYTHGISKKYKVPFDDLIGISMERFMDAVTSYEPHRATFSTHLVHQLKRLIDTSLEYQKRNEQKVQLDCSMPDSRQQYHIHKTTLYVDIENNLSENSQQYLQDLFQGAFQKAYDAKGGRPPVFPIDTICEYYGWSKNETMEVKEEITEWWKEY